MTSVSQRRDQPDGFVAPGGSRPTTQRSAESSWTVLGLAIVVGGLAGPGLTFGVSVFIDHFVDDLSLGRSAVATAYLIGTLAGAVLLPSVGSFIDRHGVRRSQAIIGLLFAGALLNMSFVNGFVWLALGFAGIRFLGQGALTLVAAVTVQVSYRRHRGLALGIHTTAVSALTALAPLALAVGIGVFGWRATWVISAVIVALVVTPCSLIGLRQPSHRQPVADDEDPMTPMPMLGLPSTRTEVLRTRSFWMLAAVIGVSAMMVTALHFHQIDLLGTVGYSAQAAAALFLPQVVGSMLAGLTIGWASDRFGVRYLPAAVMVLLLGALATGALVNAGILVILYAVLLGATAGAMRGALVTIVPVWFGLRQVGSISGALTFFQIALSAVGPVLLTATVASVGSYRLALVLLSVVPLVVLVPALAVVQGPAVPIRHANPKGAR